MFRNCLAAALRNLVRNRLYAAINIIGLALGFAAALLIALFVRDEFSYDRFFPDHQHIYLVASALSLPGRAAEYSDFMPAELAPFLKTDFPSIAAAARVVPDTLIVKHGAIESAEHIHWADPTIFDIFKLETVAGRLENALEESNGIVITRKIARKYFGRDDPIGQPLDVGVPTFAIIGGVTQVTIKSDVFKVTAVIADLPSNTHLNFNIVAAAQNANSLIARLDNAPPRNAFLNLETYIKLPSAAAATLLENSLPEFIRRRKPDLANPGNGPFVKLIPRPVASLHLTPSGSRIEKPRGNINTIYGAAAIGLMIVFAAAINFVNLMTARAMRRATEVGVRKAAGAGRRNLIVQFIGESTIYVAMGAACGLALAAGLLPRLNTFLDRAMAFGLLSDVRSLGFVIAFVIFVGILAGAYPAFVLASIRPAVVLRGTVSRQASSHIRQALVVLQFAALIGMLFATGVVYRQTRYAFSDATRLDTDQVVLIMGEPCKTAFKDGVRALPGVRGAACSSSEGLTLGTSAAGTARDANGASIAIARVSVGYGFFELYGLKPITGRFFSEEHPADVMPTDKSAPVQGAVVLNEAAVRRLGFASPQDAVGKSTSLNENTGGPSEIIGVVPDFGADAVHKVIPPILYVIDHDYQGILNVRIDGARVPETLTAIDMLWKEVGPPQPIVRQFLDQVIGQLYKDMTRQETLFTVYAGVAVAIAALGLLGLAVFTAERRTREIGIRKAMGADSRDMLRLVLWEFAKPVLWANAIAWPMAGILMQRWLEGFAYHIDLAPWMFLASSALALIIALVAVSGHALLVARARPVTALRHE